MSEKRTLVITTYDDANHFVEHTYPGATKSREELTEISRQLVSLVAGKGLSCDDVDAIILIAADEVNLRKKKVIFAL